MKKIIWIISLMLFVLATGVKADKVTLAWDSEGIVPDGYRLFQREEGNNYDYANPIKEILNNQTQTEVIVNGKPNEKVKYLWVIRSFKGNDTSGDSNEVNFIVDKINPDPPIDLEASYNENTSEVIMNWQQLGEQPFYWVIYKADGMEGAFTEFSRFDNDQSGNYNLSIPLEPKADALNIFRLKMTSNKSDSVVSTESNIIILTIDLRKLQPIQTLRITVYIRE
jgi:hypothetical protein